MSPRPVLRNKQNKKRRPTTSTYPAAETQEHKIEGLVHPPFIQESLREFVPDCCDVETQVAEEHKGLALEFKEKGNELCVKGDYYGAMQAFSNAIQEDCSELPSTLLSQLPQLLFPLS